MQAKGKKSAKPTPKKGQFGIFRDASTSVETMSRNLQLITWQVQLHVMLKNYKPSRLRSA